MRHTSIRTLSGWSVLALALVLSRSARAADCSAEIRTELDSFCATYPDADLSAQAPGLVPPGAPLKRKCSPTTKYTANALFSLPSSTARSGAAAPVAPTGLAAAPNFSKWVPVANASLACSGLLEILFVDPAASSSGPTTAAPAPALPPAGPLTAAALRSAIFTESDTTDADTEVNTPGEARDALRAYRSKVAALGGTTRSVPGTSTGAFDSVASDALQALGQIVADRASEAAYALIKQKLEDLLGCQPNGTSSMALTATCRLLVPLRIEDIAMSRDALLGALIQDAITVLEAKSGQSLASIPGATLSSALVTSVIPIVTHPAATIDDTVARTVLDAFTSDAQSATAALSPAQKVIVVSVTAYAQCLAGAPNDDPSKVLASCDIGANVDKLAGSDAAIVPAAHALAQQLVAVGTPTPKATDPRVRLRHAVDALFGSSCMLIRDTAGAATPRLACDAPTTVGSVLDVLGLAQPVVDDALDKDTNGLIAALVHALQVASSTLAGTDANGTDHRRAFLFLGGLLDYASTYANTSTTTTGSSAGSATTSAADQRTQILESLTRTMTDRSGRQGDTIVSLGGALRLMAGGRFALTESASGFNGPLSLPLGLAVTHIARSGLGFHLQVDVADLGEYLAFDKTGTVQTPSVADALAPGLTLGAAWGSSFPFVVGVTAGFSPRRALDPSNPGKKGTFNSGVTVGVHVPLLDLN